MKKTLLIFLSLSFFLSLVAQDLPIGQFKEYLHYNTFHCVAQDDENVYAATDQSILVVDKRDKSLHKWSKLSGLSEVGITTLHTDKQGRLIIAYRNSNIDIIENYKIHNIRDILNKQITGSKTINSITSFDNIAYIACDFGMVLLDLKSFLVKDSWFTVRQDDVYRAQFLTVHNQHYYLATNKGVFSLPVSATNPANFSLWKLENELPIESYKFLCSYRDRLFAVCNRNENRDSLYSFDNYHWKHDTSIKIDLYRNMEVKDDKLLVCDWNHVKIFSGSECQQYHWFPAPPVIYQQGMCATFDGKMDVWVADYSSGLVHIDLLNGDSEIITADGPDNNRAFGLFFSKGILTVVPGSRITWIQPDYTPPSLSILKEDKWWSKNFFSDYPDAGAFNSLVINPLNNKELFIASWLRGLYRYNIETSQMNCYNSNNSPLISNPIREDGEVFLSGLAFDKKNNLWMAQSEATYPLKVFEPDKEIWHSFNLSPYATSFPLLVEHIFVDSRDYKWVTVPLENQLIVLRGDLNNIEKAKADLSAQATVSGSKITCITEDRDGSIWTGCDQGVKVIYDAASVFNRPVYAKNILIFQNGYWQNLLENEYITCIEVDAANRKWIGTRSAGVFFISPNGTQELFHFTSENSPLFSNQINDIKINPENGEVFIATQEGLISFKGTATKGSEDYKNVLVYPNPVREDYSGPVAVKGLMEDSFCKITDASGNLIWQGYAYGGQLIWNGKDFYGKRPATGVYFVMASGKTGKEKKVAKFLFIQ